ncbi:ATP-binding protein [Sporosarcina pasteurii]|uniref:histidine kinase n=1 Tax=Sporosarcina pasteurii TaxID=1474 RepID=A0A380BK60_SPOPA|nr:ATP-binding protein [Sporosarcina pasteurii]MDS9470793.1 ATP-binding protein [Sporosarcina pasteurii]QBQ05538.1 HAMP domain-containing protein [Sporosarcina pasteurii]SUJ02310.1 Sensor protein srrB [Sporosarcina pasteurii]
MNRIWNSIVGKLWATILLLVTFILFIVTALLLEFLGNFHREQAEDSLRREAKMIANVVLEHKGQPLMPIIIHDVLDDETNAFITDEKGLVTHSYHIGLNKSRIERKILSTPAFSSDNKLNNGVTKEIMMPSITEEGMMEQYIVLADPFTTEAGATGTVYIYQSLEAIQATTKKTTNIVFLSAFIAFILTTIFAFFLSTRITLPLRKMRQAANELSKGNFDTRLPSLQSDEIGQLATAFNQMGRQLKYHVELISQEKEQLYSILTSMADAVITFNSDGTILLSNPEAEKILQNWYFAKGSSDDSLPPELLHMLEHSINFSEEVEDELPLNGKFYTVSISPLYSGRSIRGAVAVLRDMTAQHQLDKLRSDFIANVSHELRTPISMLQGYSEAILDGVTESDEEKDEIIQVIHEESLRMGRLVTDLLDLARMESGHMTLYKEEVSVLPFLGRIVHKFSQVAREANVNLSFQHPDEKIILDIDEDRIEQVFTNLIDNAIRHTPENGDVRLTVNIYGDTCQMTVSDTGDGIPEEDLQFIFERFYKADKARTRVKGGTGLGLSIAKNIIDAHHGMITASRGEVNGTIMSVTLPIKKCNE